MTEQVRGRLESLGYALEEGDEALLEFSARMGEAEVLSICNLRVLPLALEAVAADRAAGEFLMAKRAMGPGESALKIDAGAAVKQIQMGDTSTTFAVGEEGRTPLDVLIGHLMAAGEAELSAHRRVKW